MKVEIEGEGTKKVHISVIIRTGAVAGVKITSTAGVAGELKGKGNLSFGTSIEWSGKRGIVKGGELDWYIECECEEKARPLRKGISF